MSSTSVAERPGRAGLSERLRENLAFRIAAGIVSLAVTFCLFFWVAGRYDWLEGWAYLLLLFVGQGASSLYVMRRNPELLKRRAVVGAGTKKWDKVVLSLFGLSYLAIMIVGALDGSRYLWWPLSPWFWPAGALLYIGGIIIVTWAMVTNTHFEKTVRIQEDRDHQVVDAGPYQLVRHPGYAGTILSFPLATPLLLGSALALIPSLICIGVLILRTALEDRTLRDELDGYADYAERVGYRLLPGVW